MRTVEEAKVGGIKGSSLGPNGSCNAAFATSVPPGVGFEMGPAGDLRELIPCGPSHTRGEGGPPQDDSLCGTALVNMPRAMVRMADCRDRITFRRLEKCVREM